MGSPRSYLAEVHLVRMWNELQLPETEDAALDEYVDACEAYFRRQLVIYQNWPQHRYGPLGYTEEKVFVDQNA